MAPPSFRPPSAFAPGLGTGVGRIIGSRRAHRCWSSRARPGCSLSPAFRPGIHRGRFGWLRGVDAPFAQFVQVANYRASLTINY